MNDARTTFYALALLMLFLFVGVPIDAHAQTERVTDLNSGADDSIWSFNVRTNFITYDGALYFLADAGDSTGIELYAYDGSRAMRITDIPPGLDFNSGPSWPVVYNDGTGAKLYFAANGSEGSELYSYDGSTVQRITNINPSGDSDVVSPVVFNGKLFFNAFPSATFQSGELYSYDGSTVTRVTETGGRLNPFVPVVYDDGGGKDLYFKGTSSTKGREIYRYDGTTASLAVDVNSGSEGSRPGVFTEYQGALYFQATGEKGRELYSTDGTSAQLVKDINPSGNSNPDDMELYDDGSGAALYFRADNGTEEELYRYDGSQVTQIDIDGTSKSSFPSHMVAASGTLYFDASVNGDEELYQYDGSIPSQVADINPSGSSAPNSLTVFDNMLYFSADDGSTGRELHRTTFAVSGVSLAAKASRFVSSDGLVDFDTTGVDVNFSDVSGSGSVTVEKFSSAPDNPEGISEENASTYRHILRADGDLSFGASTEVRFDVSTLAGIEDPSEVTVYKRDTTGAGTFAALSTSYEAGANELVVTTGSFSEFVFASNTNPLPTEASADPPERFALHGNAPNPFASETTIRYDLPKPAQVSLTVYDVLGRKVSTLVDRKQPAGRKQVRFEAAELPADVYVYRLTAGDVAETRRMVVLE